jgi:S1-C subfamily serine protease
VYASVVIGEVSLIFELFLIGLDRGADLAVMRFGRDVPKNPTVIKMGNSRKYGPGRPAYGFSSPFDVLGRTFVCHELGANRYVFPSSPRRTENIVMNTNRMDTGTPVTSDKGELIGMINGKEEINMSGASQFFLSLPLNAIIEGPKGSCGDHLRKVLWSRGYYYLFIKGFLGMKEYYYFPGGVEDDDAELLTFGFNEVIGVVVKSIVPGSPIDGILKVKDKPLITHVNDCPIGVNSPLTSLGVALWPTLPGEKVKVVYRLGSERLRLVHRIIVRVKYIAELDIT